jgi:hypothetical protein
MKKFKQFNVEISLCLSADKKSVRATKTSTIPQAGLAFGESVKVRVLELLPPPPPVVPSISNAVILTLSLFDESTAMQGQTGGLIGLWGLFEGTNGLYLSNGNSLQVGPTNSPFEVEVTNINQARSSKTCFYSVGGTVLVDCAKVLSWTLDPELILRGGEG